MQNHARHRIDLGVDVSATAMYKRRFTPSSKLLIIQKLIRSSCWPSLVGNRRRLSRYGNGDIGADEDDWMNFCASFCIFFERTLAALNAA